MNAWCLGHYIDLRRRRERLHLFKDKGGPVPARSRLPRSFSSTEGTSAASAEGRIHCGFRDKWSKKGKDEDASHVHDHQMKSMTD